MELHFFPGQKLLLALRISGSNQIKVAGRYEAWSGPSTGGTDPRMPEEPTWPGKYIIAKARVYLTPSWKLSGIKWGTPLKDKPSIDDVWYLIHSDTWASVKKDHHISRKDIIRLHFELYQIRTVPPTWVFNDFGPVVVMWFEDHNNNKLLDDNETLSGQFFHTTPENEAQVSANIPVTFKNSHGCIHLHPKDRNLLFSHGFFNPGTPFIIHSYYERYLEKPL